jgi:hypothetical protein
MRTTPPRQTLYDDHCGRLLQSFLREETGTDRAEILAESETWLYHEVPSEISDGVMGGRYRGNCQKWFAMGFTGEDTDINLATVHPEFDTWRWVKPQALPELVAPFMRQLYLEILAEFRPFWSHTLNAQHCIARHNTHVDRQLTPFDQPGEFAQSVNFKVRLDIA